MHAKMESFPGQQEHDVSSNVPVPVMCINSLEAQLKRYKRASMIACA